MRFRACGIAFSASLFLAAAVLAVQSPLDLVRQTTEAVLSKLEADKGDLQKDPSRVYGVIQELVIPHFAFERMSRLVLGRYWRRATPEQRKSFVEQFSTLLVRTYGTALLQYTGQTVKYLPLREEPDATDVTVKTEIQQPSGSSVSVQYSLYLQGGEWKVYDVVIEGVSLVINYRHSFGQEIENRGIDALIRKLEEKNRSSGG